MQHKDANYKINIIGWYGRNAIGDDIIFEVTKKFF